MEDDIKWKTTSITKSGISLQLLVGSVPNSKLRLVKLTSITKSRISQQLLVPYFPNFKLKLILPNQTFQIFQKTISNGI